MAPRTQQQKGAKVVQAQELEESHDPQLMAKVALVVTPLKEEVVELLVAVELRTQQRKMVAHAHELEEVVNHDCC